MEFIIYFLMFLMGITCLSFGVMVWHMSNEDERNTKNITYGIGVDKNDIDI